MSSSRLENLRYDLNTACLSLTERTPDLPELECLCHLEFFVSSRPRTTFDAMLSSPPDPVWAHMTQILSASVPKALRSLTITFTLTLLGSFVLWVRENQYKLQQYHPLEDAILVLKNPHVRVSILQAKCNRVAFWLKVISGCFPGLHERGILQVECSSVDGAGEECLGHDAALTAMAISPDSRFVATAATDRSIIIWSAAAPPQTCLVEMQVTYLYVTSLLFSNTGDLLAGAQRFEVFIWRVTDGCQIFSIGGPEWKIACAWRRDGLDRLTFSTLGTTAYGAVSLSVTTRYVQAFQNENGYGSTPVSSSCGLVLAGDSEGPSRGDLIVQSSSGRLIAAVVRSGAAMCYIWWMVNSTSTYEAHRLTYMRTHARTQPSYASFAGEDLFVVGFSDGSIRWWDVSSFPLTTTAPRGVLTRGSRVITLSASPMASLFIALFDEDAATPVLVHTEYFEGQGRSSDIFSTGYTFLHGHTAPVKALCISPCERYVATASEDTTVRLWSTTDGSLIWTFLEHGAVVTHILFSPDERTLATADKEGQVCIRSLSRF
ncbi:WD40 repeat-like protein [Polyporus arcularius HHB13444]|uniref:WD40 repeat-like protein n=1 Tax=Polyporus arcularius HHB13444 TaxID=1314778 RepID=A0A5C3NSM8_9APHY|nr:WD40 repeat-like protein [Polyporus arcularius HHB13444]